MANRPQLPRLRAIDQIVERSGAATVTLQTWWDQICRGIEGPSLEQVTVVQVAARTPAPRAGMLVYVMDEAGGEVAAVSDSAGNYRRTTDRAIVS